MPQDFISGTCQGNPLKVNMPRTSDKGRNRSMATNLFACFLSFAMRSVCWRCMIRPPCTSTTSLGRSWIPRLWNWSLPLMQLVSYLSTRHALISINSTIVWGGRKNSRNEALEKNQTVEGHGGLLFESVVLMNQKWCCSLSLLGGGMSQNKLADPNSRAAVMDNKTRRKSSRLHFLYHLLIVVLFDEWKLPVRSKTNFWASFVTWGEVEENRGFAREGTSLDERFNLPWDRYIRLNAAAEQDQAWAIVVAVDVLEHVPPEQRAEFLTELSRVTREFCPSV